MPKSSDSRNSIVFFPSLKEMSGNPYWAILVDALQKAGVAFLSGSPDIFTLKWLFQNRNLVNILHIHFIRPFYLSGTPGKIRFIYVLRLAFNMLLARSLGYELVYTFHDSEPPVQVQPVWADILAHHIVIKLSNKVIVHCGVAEQLLSQKYGRRNNVFIVDHPNYINWYPNTITKAVARKKLGLSGELITFAFFGAVRPNKGVQTLIQAFRKTQDRKFRLIIAGQVSKSSDSYSQHLQEIARGDDRISFYFRQIPDDEVQVFMKSADIVVLPFSKILTSGSAILAMSFGRPVIVPKLGCLPELVGVDVGWQFEPGNPDSLANAMQSAAISDFCQFGQRAYDKISLFSQEHLAAQTIQAYLNHSE